MKIFLTLILLAQSLMFAAVSNGTAAVSSTPQSLASITGLSGNVSNFRITVIPGYTGKIYVGSTSSMNTSTYADVMRVLYPNASGGHSDFFASADPSGKDGIPLNQIFVHGAVSGERFTWEVTKTGTNAAKNMVPYYAGPLAPTAQNAAACFHVNFASQKYLVGYQASVVPGQTGKVRLGRQLDSYYQPDSQLRGVGRILWPNTGTNSPDSANTESLDVWASANVNYESDNPIHGYNLCAFPEVYGEFPLVVAWQRTPYTERILSGIPSYEITQGPIAITGSNQQIDVSKDTAGSRLRLWTIPGTSGKVYLGSSSSMNKSTLSGVFRVIFPNPNGGHSDGWDLEYPQRYLGLFKSTNLVYANGDSSGEFLVSIKEADREDSVSNRKWDLTQASISLGSTPVQIFGTQNKISQIAVRNVPGQCSKIYVGGSSMNISTLANVYKILYPNCSGGIAEEFLISNGALRNIESQNFYLASDSTVDALVEVRTESRFSNWSGAGYRALASGPIGSASPVAVSTAGLIQFSVIPGYSGKIRLGNATFGGASQPDSTYSGVLGVLFPNSGNTGQSNARSESRTVTGTASQFYIWPEVSGEKVLATVWGN